MPGQWTFVSHLTLAVRARTVESDRREIGFWPRTSYFLESVLKVDLNHPYFISEAMEAWKGYSVAQDTLSEREGDGMPAHACMAPECTWSHTSATVEQAPA